MAPILQGALLAIVEEAGLNVLTLTETLDEADFATARLTREETLRQLHTMARSLVEIPPPVRKQLPEIDWEAWAELSAALAGQHRPDAAEAWFAARSLVPATLLWLRVYRKNAPELFAMKA